MPVNVRTRDRGGITVSCHERGPRAVAVPGVRGSEPLALQREETGPVWQEAVVTAGAGTASLVQQLQVARVDGHGLIGVVADEIAVADVVGPGGAAVGLAGEGIALGCRLRRP